MPLYVQLFVRALAEDIFFEGAIFENTVLQNTVRGHCF